MIIQKSIKQYLLQFLLKVFYSVFLFLLFPSLTFAIQKIDGISITPNFIFINTSTPIIITAKISPDDNLISSSISLVQVIGNSKTLLGRLYDDGTHGDENVGDNIFTTQVTINKTAATTLKYQISVGYRSTLKRLLSDIFVVDVVEPSFPTEPEPNKIIYDNGSQYPLNQLILIFPEGTTKDIINSVVVSINGKIIGFVPSASAYQVEVTTSTVEELDTLIAQLQTDGRIDGALKNFMMDTFSHNIDLANLSKYNPDLTKPYNLIKIQGAWEWIEKITYPPYKINIGILDSGIDKSHNEFNNKDGILNVKINEDAPSDWLTGHGTKVAGIIGANNLFTTDPASPQMV